MPEDIVFFVNDTATTEIYTLSLHDALPIFHRLEGRVRDRHVAGGLRPLRLHLRVRQVAEELGHALVLVRLLAREQDRKSTRLNSSHANISYAVFCLKKTTSRSPFSHLSISI